MPKSFTDQESVQIRKDLMSKGKELFTQFGLKKTSIEDLVKSTGIAKGSFYRFFPSKEVLYLEILEEEEQKIRSSMFELNLEGKNLNKIDLKSFFNSIVNQIDQNPILLKMFDENALEQLMRKIPTERINHHIEKDDKWSSQLFKSWKNYGYLPDTDEMVFSALFRSIFILFTQKNIIGNDHFLPVMDLLFDFISSGIINSRNSSKEK